MGIDRFRRLETGEVPRVEPGEEPGVAPEAPAPGTPSPATGTARGRNRFGQLERDGELAERKTALETADRLIALERERSQARTGLLVAAPFVAAPLVIGLMALLAVRCA